jgi:hypothetical protein
MRLLLSWLIGYNTRVYCYHEARISQDLDE